MAYDSMLDLLNDAREVLETLEMDPTDTDAQDLLAEFTQFTQDYGYDGSDVMAELESIANEVTTFTTVDGFQAYAEELIGELYGLDTLPAIISANINWEGVADDLRHDYTEYNINGTEYYVA